LEDRINLGLSALFKAVEVGDTAYFLYVDMGEGKLFARMKRESWERPSAPQTATGSSITRKSWPASG